MVSASCGLRIALSYRCYHLVRSWGNIDLLMYFFLILLTLYGTAHDYNGAFIFSTLEDYISQPSNIHWLISWSLTITIAFLVWKIINHYVKGLSWTIYLFKTGIPFLEMLRHNVLCLHAVYPHAYFVHTRETNLPYLFMVSCYICACSHALCICSTPLTLTIILLHSHWSHSL